MSFYKSVEITGQEFRVNFLNFITSTKPSVCTIIWKAPLAQML